jgi:hypothetical protein
MRTVAVIALASATCLAACQKAAAPASSSAASATSAAPAASAPASGAIAPADLPRRKAGLWKQTVSMEGPQAGMAPTIEMCVDPATESRMASLGQQMGKDRCSSQTFSRNLDGSISFNATCKTGAGGTMVTKGTITGDFNSSYKVAIDSQMTGASVAAANGEHKVEMTATWEGPCPDGEKAGDATMIMPDGSKMKMPNMAEMSAMNRPPPGQ